MWQGKGLFLNIGIEEQQNYYKQWGKESISELRIKIISIEKVIWDV